MKIVTVYGIFNLLGIQFGHGSFVEYGLPGKAINAHFPDTSQ